MLRVLLIEDNPGDAYLIRQMLGDEGGADILLQDTTDRLSSGLTLLATQSYQVILSDLSLPDASGLETVNRLLAQAPGTPLVVLTGTNDSTLATDAVRAGAQDYLVKGQVTGALLARSLSYAVERKRATLEEQRYLRSLASLSKTAMGFIELDADGDIYQFIARQLREFLGDVAVAVSSYDPVAQLLRVQVILGLDDMLPALKQLLGKDCTELTLSPREEDWNAIARGTLVHTPRGLCDLLFGLVPPDMCREFSEQAQLGDIYCAGLLQKSGLLGTVAIGLKRGQELHNLSALEILIHLASVALQHRQMEEEIRLQSVIDELTGLYNRRGFFTLAEQQVKIAGRTGRSMLLLFIDVDNLKLINDMCGHQFGDNALIETAAAFTETFRGSDILARIGGDEFVALVIDVFEDELEVLQHRLHERLANRHADAHGHYPLSVSLGYAYFNPEEPCTVDDLLRRADAVMYEHKRGKRKAASRAEL